MKFFSTSCQELLDRHAEKYGDKPFIIHAGSGARIDFAAAANIVRETSRQLAALGVSEGSRVTVLSDNSAEEVLTHVAILALGATVNPISYELSRAYLGEILASVRPTGIVVPASRTEIARGVAGQYPQLPLWPLEAAADESRGLLAAGAQRAEGDVPAGIGSHDPAGMPALIVYTSGTTSRPKGVVHSFGSYAHSVEAAVDLLEASASDVILEFRSFSWVSPHVIGLGTSLSLGCTLVVAPKFSSSRFLRWVAEFGVTVAVSVPTALTMLLESDLKAFDDLDLSSLRFFTSSTAPLAPAQYDKFLARFHKPVVQFFGMSEGGWIAGNRPSANRAGTVGRPALHQHVRVVDDAGRSVASGEVGEIVVGGPQSAIGYMTDGGEIQPIPDRDYLLTGDLGSLDDDGYLRVVGRKKDLIIRGGVNISPAEISEAICAHPAVHEAATIGVPDEVYGERVISFVCWRSGATPDLDGLRGFVVEHIPEFKVPSEFVTLRELPRTARDKVDSVALRELYDQRKREAAQART